MRSDVQAATNEQMNKFSEIISKLHYYIYTNPKPICSRELTSNIIVVTENFSTTLTSLSNTDG